MRYERFSVGELTLGGASNGVVTVLEINDVGHVRRAIGTTVPADGTAGYAKGAIFSKTDVGAKMSGIYENLGTSASCAFVLVSGISVVALTAAQTKALFATPIALVAAPGAGKIVAIDEIMAKNVFGTVAYTGGNALEFRYTDGSGAKVTADIASTFINIASGTAYRSVKGVTTELTPVANAAVVVRVPTADPGAGDGILTFTTRYRIVTP